VVFETASGRIVTDEIYVRTGVAYEVRTEVVGERGSAMIGLDQHLQVKSVDGRWGGQITPGFVERFGAAYDTELQRWVDAARAGTIDGPAAWDGYAAVAVCEAGVEAVRTGEKVMVRLGVKPGSVSSSVAEPTQSVRGQTERAVRHPDTAEFDAELDSVEPSHHEPKVTDDSPEPGITAPDMDAAR